MFTLATVTNVTIVAYYLDGLTVKNHVFKPTQKQSIAIIEVCFINGHYDLIVDATAQTKPKYESMFFNQDFKTSAKETLQKPPPSKAQHSVQFFSTRQRLTGGTTTSINAELIFTTGKTAVTKTVT